MQIRTAAGPGGKTAAALVLLVSLALAAQAPAVAATQCVPAGNPGPCDAFHATIQAAINAAAPGDTVLVGPGVYNESPNINQSLVLTSNAGRDATFIQLQTGPTYLGSLTIAGSDVTVDGFTVIGRDHACPTLAASNIFLTTGLNDIYILNNRLQVGQVGPCTNYDDGFGFITTYAPGGPYVNSLTVTGNIIEPLTPAGGRRAFYVNPSVLRFQFDQNQITGFFAGTSLTQAASGLVTQNQIDGQGLGGYGLGTWGYPDAGVWGHTIFSYNTFTGLTRGVAIFESNQVSLECNLLQGNGAGVEIYDGYGTLNFDPTTIFLRYNRFKVNTSVGLNNAAVTPGTVNAEDNFWGSPTGPSGIGPGGGDAVFGDVDFDPFLTQSDIAACDPLSVKLDSLSAAWTDGGVLLRWATLAEKDTAGFRLLRATGPRKVDAIALLTLQPIPAAGNEIQGAEYEYLDTSADAQQVLFYYLEEFDNRGAVSRYGPIAVERPAQGSRTRGPVRVR